MIMLWLKTLTNKSLTQPAVWVGVALGLVDLLSIAGGFNPVLSSTLAILLALGWLIIASRQLLLAINLLLAELIVGSFGYLFSFEFGSTDLSLRFLLFVAAFGLMLYRLASNRHHIIFKHPWRWWFLGALVALVWAAGRGYYLWQENANIFLDMNGYLYLLLTPLFLEALASAGISKILSYARLILLPAVIWLSLRTVIVLYIFTHFEAGQIIWLYKWYRDSGLGEITPAGQGFFRVFSQSHLYSSLVSIIGFTWLWHQLKDKTSFPYILTNLHTHLLTLIPLIALIASLSRSLWLGAVAAWILIPLLSPAAKKFKLALGYVFISLVLVASASGAVLAVAKLNWPVSPLGSGSAQAFTSRFGSEAASQARLKLLVPLLTAAAARPVLGSGFGATVTYFSTDPRLVQSTAGASGLVTTYAFEWGYLDFWYKFGLVGLVFYLAWLFKPWFLGLKLYRQQNLVGAGALALTALLVTHLTTPYLNHPLGLGAVIALGSLIVLSPKQEAHV